LPDSSTGGATVTHAGSNGGLGAAVERVAQRAASLARLELRLALVELRWKAAALAAGIGAAVTGAVVALLAILFLLVGGALALALVVPMWAAFLVLGGACVLTGGLLLALALLLVRKALPPVPQQAVEEARRTTEVLRARG
jgi:hypothetical protein